jgi:hypothetical protein
LFKESIVDSKSGLMTAEVLQSRLVNYLFWGFDETENGINDFFIKRAPSKSLNQYFNFISRQTDYYKNLKGKELEKFRKTVFWLYKNALERFSLEDDKESFVRKLSILNFYDDLSDEIYEILKCNSYKMEMHHDIEDLFENLIRFLKLGNPNFSNIANLIKLLEIDVHYMSKEVEKLIYEVIEKLYQNQQKDSADKFCNKMARKGVRFLIPLYNKYN